MDSPSPTQIKSTLAQIRGDLFDMDSSNTTLVKILDKVQQLTEAENEVVQRQQAEIDRLKDLLERERGRSNSMNRDDYDVVSSGSFGSTTTEDEDAFEKELAKKASFAQMDTVKTEISELNSVKSKIHEEIDTLRHQVQLLVEERTTLIKEVQVYTHMKEVSDELDDATSQIVTLQNQVRQLQIQLEMVTSERAEAVENSETQRIIRQELEKEMSQLYKEKISLETMLEDRHTIATMPSSITSDGGMERLKREIVIIKAENESLRVSAKREAATIAGLEDEIRSLNAENLCIRNSFEEQHVSKKICQGSIDDRQNIECPRERLGSAGNLSGENSVGHECDNVSILFGQDSIHGARSVAGTKRSDQSVISADDASDHKSIRMHAEKLLYWANKAAERSKSPSPGSVASGSYATPAVSRQPVPTTIGLPPRSSAKKNRALPPRPPSDTASIGNTTNKSDKENGGSTFNVKRNTEKAVIFNLDKVQSMESCCQCSTSPFSGNDAHSEFYLPKLGLACACGQSAINHDRASFSKNPTSLQNILRQWQCDFLATLGVYTADQLLKAHKSGANDMARAMKRWREENNLPLARSKECYVALMVWSRTAKVVLRSIEKQKEAGEECIEKPGFLDIACSDTYTVGSVSTLGQMSSVGGRLNEMMEI